MHDGMYGSIIHHMHLSSSVTLVSNQSPTFRELNANIAICTFNCHGLLCIMRLLGSSNGMPVIII